MGPKAEYVKLIVAGLKSVDVIGINSMLVPYISSTKYKENFRNGVSYTEKGVSQVYGSNLFEEVYRYSKKARLIAETEEFDIIHCHDWMTFQAGIEAKEVSGKKLVVHVHATEFDRGGGNGVNQYVYNTERAGMHAADKIIAVSNFTKNIIVNNYGIPEHKVDVVYNAVEQEKYTDKEFKIKKHDRIVLFLGRITLQKGPEYFLYAAKKALEFRKDIKFIMAGGGDMLPQMIELASYLGISDNVLFTGVVKGKEVSDLYQMADVYILPSVSEPFGITPLESLNKRTPVIISRQSGVSEILSHALKVDFWDVDDLTDKILAVLRYEELRHTLKEHGSMEVKKFTWYKSAKSVIEVYKRVLRW